MRSCSTALARASCCCRVSLRMVRRSARWRTGSGSTSSPDVPLCQPLRHVVRRSGKEAYAARWYEHGLRVRRYERVGAGENVQSAPAGVCAHDVQKFFCQAAAVVEQVHTLTLRGNRIREENSPLTRDGT